MPGPEIRLTEGDTLRVKVNNYLGAGTTIHWHGLPMVNDMDGIPNVTQPPIAGGEEFVYELVVSGAGSYMYHSHVGLQLDRGLYGPDLLIQSWVFRTLGEKHFVLPKHADHVLLTQL